jgi:hypothetical protein
MIILLPALRYKWPVCKESDGPQTIGALGDIPKLAHARPLPPEQMVLSLPDELSGARITDRRSYERQTVSPSRAREERTRRLVVLLDRERRRVARWRLRSRDGAEGDAADGQHAAPRRSSRPWAGFSAGSVCTDGSYIPMPVFASVLGRDVRRSVTTGRRVHPSSKDRLTNRAVGCDDARRRGTRLTTAAPS